jgi:hypothetical protein
MAQIPCEGWPEGADKGIHPVAMSSAVKCAFRLQHVCSWMRRAFPQGPCHKSCKSGGARGQGRALQGGQARRSRPAQAGKPPFPEGKGAGLSSCTGCRVAERLGGGLIACSLHRSPMPRERVVPRKEPGRSLTATELGAPTATRRTCSAEVRRTTVLHTTWPTATVRRCSVMMR